MKAVIALFTTVALVLTGCAGTGKAPTCSPGSYRSMNPANYHLPEAIEDGAVSLTTLTES